MTGRVRCPSNPVDTRTVVIESGYWRTWHSHIQYYNLKKLKTYTSYNINTYTVKYKYLLTQFNHTAEPRTTKIGTHKFDFFSKPEQTENRKKYKSRDEKLLTGLFFCV